MVAHFVSLWEGLLQEKSFPARVSPDSPGLTELPAGLAGAPRSLVQEYSYAI
jgi:hypothetical protein